MIVNEKRLAPPVLKERCFQIIPGFRREADFLGLGQKRGPRMGNPFLAIEGIPGYIILKRAKPGYNDAFS